MAGVALAKMDWVGVAKIGLALKVEWGPVFAGESREKACQRGAVCHKSDTIPSPPPTRCRWLSVVVADPIGTENISSKANLFQNISTIYIYDML